MQWLINLIDKLTCGIPRIWIVEPDESGIRTTLGRHINPTPAGWYIFWPLIQSVIKITITPQIIDLREQSLTTLDGKKQVISGAVEYDIRDAMKAILHVQDYDKNLPTLCLGKISDYVEAHPASECRSALIKAELRKEIREHVNKWGIRILNIFITDNVSAETIRVMLHATTGSIRLIQELAE